MSIGTINYSSLYFKNKTPALIREELINKALKKLKLELQSNVSSVETNSGGDHGYLDLVLTEEEYTLVPYTQPFIVLNYLPLLTIPPISTPKQELVLKDRHQEARRLYLDIKNIEKALLRYI